jgi:hypothetical protein
VWAVEDRRDDARESHGTGGHQIRDVVEKMSSNAVIGVFSKGPIAVTPPFRMSASRDLPARSSSTRRTASTSDVGSRRSSATGVQRGWLRPEHAGLRMPAKTVHPSPKRRSVTARPKPRDAPTTRTVRMITDLIEQVFIYVGTAPYA